ncbi:MAG: SDR family oxidoreductase [Pseudomonadota bacterium]|jgi:NAD(P)-dependent dehydrogenase (short-subunit alcohol dehydrogenase family)|nr:SDR family oxidoreductase [Pseudomonadota bacterium]
MNASIRSAIITGAGTGVGRAAAIALADAGYSIALAGRRRERLEETAALIKTTATGPLIIPTDVRNAAEIGALFEKTRTEFGRLDLLFNNAGTGAPPGVLLEDLTLEQWQTVVDVNLTAVFLCTQHAIRIMKDQQPAGGRIINNGSISAHTPRPDAAPYTTTKHAITGLTKSTALDGRKYDIACGQIDIGNAQTPMTARMDKGVAQPSGEVAVEPTFDVANVGAAIRYMAELPLDANALFMTVMATKMPYVGRG